MNWLIIILIIAFGVLLHVYNRTFAITDNTTIDDDDNIYYQGPVNYAWRNNWLIDRKMNTDWKINLEPDLDEPYMGSSLHKYYS